MSDKLSEEIAATESTSNDERVARGAVLTDRDRQVVGYLVLENGIFIMGLGLLDAMPFLVEIGVLLDLFVAIFVMGIILNHISREFGRTDAAELTSLKASACCSRSSSYPPRSPSWRRSCAMRARVPGSSRWAASFTSRSPRTSRSTRRRRCSSAGSRSARSGA